MAGPGFPDAAAFAEVTFRSELLACVPAGWRAVGRLQVTGTEHELACHLGLHHDDTPLEGPKLLNRQQELGHRLKVGSPHSGSPA